MDAFEATGGAVVDEHRAASAAILVASPRAATSPHVDARLIEWTGERSPEALLILLVGGELDWSLATDSFDEVSTTALSRTAQRTFRARPLWLDARGGFSRDVLTRALATVNPASVAAVPAPGSPSVDATAGRAAKSTSRRWIIAATAVVVCAVTVIALVSLGSNRGDTPPPTTGRFPPPTSDVGPAPSEPGWTLLAAGVAIGLAAGVVGALVLGRVRRRKQAQRAVPPLPASEPRSGSRSGVFISHNFHAEHELALRVAADLGPDVEVWVAPESIAPGEPWLDAVERGLEASRVFVALLSKASLASGWVRKEIQAAMELEVQSELRLIPVQVEDCDVPILLRTYQRSLPSGYDELIEETRRLVGAPR